MNNLKNTIIKLSKILIRDDKLRGKIKAALVSTHSKIFPMKLGASYSVWDGEELLESSIKSIRQHCDYVNVVWQKTSWRGEPCDENLENLLQDLKSKGLIDEIILFEPNLKLETHQNELDKRNLGLSAVKKQNCTHFLTIDTDEFYKPEEFEEAKEFIRKNRITHSFCNIYGYYTPNYRDIDVSRHFVPFIHKINKFTKLKRDCYSPTPFLVDTTRQIPITKRSKICMLSMICMHHFSVLRTNIEKKYRNTSAALNAEEQAEYLQKSTPAHFENLLNSGKIVFVQDNFNITLPSSGN